LHVDWSAGYKAHGFAGFDEAESVPVTATSEIIRALPIGT